MYANKITITEVEQLAKDVFGDCTITETEYNGIHKINLGHQVIYANDRFVDEFHKEMLRQVSANNFEKWYDKHYGK